ncbi:MAG: acyl carrier protein [Acidimicrobiia bacterium]
MLEERLHRIFHDVLGVDPDQLSDGTTAAEIEGWDSLAHVTLMFSIEQEFGIQFAGDEFATLSDVGALRTLIEAKL